jgi:hypothetical protein
MTKHQFVASATAESPGNKSIVTDVTRHNQRLVVQALKYLPKLNQPLRGKEKEIGIAF